MNTNTDRTLQPLSDAETRAIIDDFDRDGYRVIRNVLTPHEIFALKEAVNALFEDPKYRESDNVYSDFIAVRLFETASVFVDMLTREPIISLVERILGDDCHLVAQNVVRNRPGEAISQFHVDDLVIFPVPDGVERHDSRLRMPVHILTVQMLLTDAPDLAHGPSEFVPGSHYSGREPNDTSAPAFEGRGPVPVYGKAGDIYLHNGQCWHRGAPNTSVDTRYLFQQTYGRRWVSQRFYPFVNYQLPQAIIESGNDRLKRVLGIHPKGPYG